MAAASSSRERVREKADGSKTITSRLAPLHRSSDGGGFLGEREREREREREQRCRKQPRQRLTPLHRVLMAATSRRERERERERESGVVENDHAKTHASSSEFR